MNKLLMIPSLLCFVSCSNTANTSDGNVSFVGERTIQFIGPITASSASAFADAASKIKGKFVLEITSAGGNAASSLDIADIIEKRSSTVVVKSYCMSGCTYVFLAANTKIVTKDSVVGFHTTVKSNNELVARSFMYDGQRMRGNADYREVELFKKKGISLDILDKADDVLGALCVGQYKGDASAGDGREIAFGWKIHSWTLSLTELNRLGVKNIKGYWPNSQNELNSLYHRYFSKGFTGAFIDDLTLYSDRRPRLPVCA